MKARFRNKTTMDKTTCRDFLALTWPKNSGILRYVLLGVGLVSIGYATVQLTLYGSEMIRYAIGLYLMAAAAVFLALWGYVFRLGRYVRGQMAVWRASTLEKEVDFFDSELRQTSRLGELSFAYGSIDGLLENKRCFVIQMGTNALLIRKDGFIKGEPEAFHDFMKKIILNNH